jgi:hypothetical protein
VASLLECDMRHFAPDRTDPATAKRLKCSVCQASVLEMLHQILGMETQENRKLKEYEIVEILEGVCNKDMNEYGWEPPTSSETTLLLLPSPSRGPVPVPLTPGAHMAPFSSRFDAHLTMRQILADISVILTRIHICSLILDKAGHPTHEWSNDANILKAKGGWVTRLAKGQCNDVFNEFEEYLVSIISHDGKTLRQQNWRSISLNHSELYPL